MSGPILLLTHREFTSAVVPPFRQKAFRASPLEFSPYSSQSNFSLTSMAVTLVAQPEAEGGHQSNRLPLEAKKFLLQLFLNSLYRLRLAGLLIDLYNSAVKLDVILGHFEFCRHLGDETVQNLLLLSAYN